MKNSIIRCLILSAVIAGCTCILPAHASIVLNNTRIVYEEQSREASVKLTNVGNKPLVVQSWIDDGNVGKDPSLMRLPFILMPPITRVEPGKGQTLRLMYTGESLPKDKESVFYLNVLEIPPRTAVSVDKNVMQIALRSRIKVFFRPSDLKRSASEAPEQLRWNLIKKEEGWMLECSNPSSYYVSMSEVSLTSPTQSSRIGDGMVAPGGKLDLPLTAAPMGNASVKFQIIDDYGAAREHVSTLIK
ncbi:fimbrial biogenesis chaperone [Aeromonas caviae]|uniref:fimbrial biogenesis chaperone n=1 Tax=Aeromonas caviae TaxID=648 RepID=UPI0029D9BCAF|nr:fimbria/pilus periplasmic chaperone [Aeromonas caviae]MDX7871218.1 fimbria/pilus periplasmic chaperone [Aeromonas caviae]